MLIKVSHCGRLNPMQPRPGMSPYDRLLSDIVVHAGVTFQSQQNAQFLLLFVRMMDSPGMLKVSSKGI